MILISLIQHSTGSHGGRAPDSAFQEHLKLVTVVAVGTHWHNSLRMLAAGSLSLSENGCHCGALRLGLGVLFSLRDQ